MLRRIISGLLGGSRRTSRRRPATTGRGRRGGVVQGLVRRFLR